MKTITCIKCGKEVPAEEVPGGYFGRECQTPTIRLERCRSHEVNTVPQPWESFREFSTEDELREFVDSSSLFPPANASGDQYRVVLGDEVFGVLDFIR